MDEIEQAARRAQAQHPELGSAIEVVADTLWPGEGVDQVHQAAVQAFLWWDVPRRHEPRDWDALLEAAAVLLGAVGNDRLAEIARSEQTKSILDAWKVDEAVGITAFKSAQRASGVDPPDTDVLQWSTILGPYETDALEEAERALGEAVACGDLVPGKQRAAATARRITERVLTTPLAFPPGQTHVGLVTTERLSHWIELARHPALSEWRASVANGLLSPVAVRDPDIVVAPVRWLLELCASPGGVVFTSSGYLPPVSVVEAAERFGWWDWPKPPRSEADVHQLTAIREASRRLGLLRLRRRRLSTTDRGKQLLDHAAELWSLVATETEEGGDFALAVTEVIALRLIQGPATSDQLEAELFPILFAQGWSSGGTPITLDDVASAIYIPIRWWSLFGVLDEEQFEWDQENRRLLKPHTYGLNADGKAMAFAFLRARAVRPRHSVYE